MKIKLTPLECGVRKIQFVLVSHLRNTNYVFMAVLHLSLCPFTTEITCSSLDPPSNGKISYDSDREDSFGVGTIATYMCSAGYALIGSVSRTCMDDDQQDTVGVWNGNAPTCEGKI